MRGGQVCDELSRQLKCKNDADLSRRLGVTSGRISQLRKQKQVSARYVAMLVRRVATRQAARTLKETVKPIVEFFPIEKCKVRDNGRDFPFDASHLHGKQLCSHLKGAVGIYAFYNSQAEIIYFGKTEKLNLWTEIVNAYNRTSLPNGWIYRVRHPWGRYKSTKQQTVRKVRLEKVKLSDIASYFSAYSVVPEMVGVLESLVIRIAPNDLINARIEAKDMRAFAPATM